MPAISDPPAELGLGYPFDGLGRAALEFDAADKRCRAAQAAGDAEALRSAEWDRDGAVDAHAQIKADAAKTFTAMFRFAVEANPGAVAALIVDALEHAPAGRAGLGCVDDLEARAEALEAAAGGDR